MAMPAIDENFIPAADKFSLDGGDGTRKTNTAFFTGGVILNFSDILKEFTGSKGGSGNSFKWNKNRGQWFKLLLALGILGMVLIVFGSIGGTSQYESGSADGAVGAGKAARNGGQVLPGQEQDIVGADKAMAEEEKYLAKRLADMLAKIDGAGEVSVTVRLESSTKSEYAFNKNTSRRTTQEKDQAGGTRVITEDSENGEVVLVQGSGGYQSPLVKSESAAEVAGVLVVAEGAHDINVKAELFKAVKVALGIEPHKIMVVPMKK